MKTNVIYFLIILQSSLLLYSQDFISESLSTEIEEFILNEYVILDSNSIYKEVNNQIQENFLHLLQDYKSYDQSELDTKAMEIFQLFYNEIHFGLLEDSSDYRRQSCRAAFCYSSIALCSQYDTSYYLDLAKVSLNQNEEFYYIQTLVDIYIHSVKSSLPGIRSSIHVYNERTSNLSSHSNRMEEVQILIEKISEGLPPENK